MQYSSTHCARFSSSVLAAMLCVLTQAQHDVTLGSNVTQRPAMPMIQVSMRPILHQYDLCALLSPMACQAGYIIGQHGVMCPLLPQYTARALCFVKYLTPLICNRPSLLQQAVKQVLLWAMVQLANVAINSCSRHRMLTCAHLAVKTCD